MAVACQTSELERKRVIVWTTKRIRTTFLLVALSLLLSMSTNAVTFGSLSSPEGDTGRVLVDRTMSSGATAPSLTSPSEGAWVIKAAVCASGTSVGSSPCSDGFFDFVFFLFWVFEPGAGGGAPGTRRAVAESGVLGVDIVENDRAHNAFVDIEQSVDGE